MSLSSNYPTTRPSLLLDFAKSKRVDPRVTFTRASTATYFDASGTLRSAAANAPRIDFDPATLACRGLLVEEQRANLFTYSEAFNTTPDWTATRSSITADATTSPDKTANADKLVEDTTASSSHSITQAFNFVSGTTYTFSIFVKAAERTAVRVLFPAAAFTSNLTANFDIAAGGWRSSSPTPSAALTLDASDIGNGWYRISASAVATASSLTTILLYLLDSPSSTGSYTGDGTSGLYLWGAQLEAGAFPTSYIPTTTTSLTRSADVASVTTLSPWFNQAEGTFVASASIIGNNSTSAGVTFANGILKTTDATTNATFSRALLFGTNNSPVRYQFSHRDASINASIFDNSYDNPVTIGKQYILAGAYQNSTGGSFSVDGRAASTSSAPVTPNTATRMLVGAGFTGGIAGAPGSDSMFLNGYIQRITYYNTRLPNAQLQALTAP